MATTVILLLILTASLLAVPILSYPISLPVVDQKPPYLYIHYKRAEDRRYRPSLVSFLYRQPDGTHLATIRYYRIVFHCNILPGSLYLRFSKLQPHRTLVQNRQDPSTIFAFRSVGAYSRVQIQNYVSGVWLCMNKRGRIIHRLNITINNLACTFRQNSDGPYMTLTSELDSSRLMTFNTLHLLSVNPILHRYYGQYMINNNTNTNRMFKREECNRFMFDSQIDKNLFNRTIHPFVRVRH
ncbi:unnamed protein product [Adineta steineri]|uniref:Uncharacterized protein n=1 Tax=Adineta steineri TaxID=433720 RepID=A0A818M7W0_9BILA|nr:unnamed protein product [Adineta steineri]CAF1092782.1 unnamed protein product [Adineta steineri]CAF1132935.1 unnamed protein product [Adineta steineri]CAF1145725.1 unnamed protein product [Adineta steineri]CAF1401859.1 unnamed protein product [Adineta steineri]